MDPPAGLWNFGWWQPEPRPPSQMPQNASSYPDIYTESPLASNHRVTLKSSTPFTPIYVKDLVTKSADPAQTYASRVQGRQILLENPARPSKATKERAEKKAKRLADKARRAGAFASRTAQKRGLWRLRPEETKFERFLPLHVLWMGYMSELLALSQPPSPSIAQTQTQTPSDAAPNTATMHARLVKADFNGSLMTVRQSKNPCLVGLSGIVVHETENAFKIVTRKDQQKLIPKQNSIFMFGVPLYSTGKSASLPSSLSTIVTGMTPAAAEDRPTASPEEIQTVLDLPHIEFELYGNQFCFRAAERAGRKFKYKETIEL